MFHCIHTVPHSGFENCERNRTGDSKRKRRVVALYNDISIDARPSYFPSAVEIMHTPYCNLKKRSECKGKKAGADDESDWITHVCGGTLLGIAMLYKYKIILPEPFQCKTKRVKRARLIWSLLLLTAFALKRGTLMI